jgi:hypothetical protein
MFGCWLRLPPNWMRRSHGTPRKHRALSGGSSMKRAARKRIAERPQAWHPLGKTVDSARSVIIGCGI